MSAIPRSASIAIALSLAATAAFVGASSASASTTFHDAAHSHHGTPPALSQHVLASNLTSPLRTAVSHDGVAYVSENDAGRIDRVSPNGHTQVVYTDPNGYEVGGLSLAGHSLYFTVTQSDPSTMTNYDSWLKVLTPYGHVRTIADLHAYEQTANPDSGTTYGFRSIDPACAEQWPSGQGPASYPGAVDSHPYATYALHNGWTYVADAGANDVLLVSPWGHVSTVAVLPAIPFTITSDAASGLGLPSCFVGTTYYFEPVPTDVEMGPDGMLYVTSLPGGPEGPQLGARGSVFAVSTSGWYGSHRDHGHGAYRSGSWGHHHRGFGNAQPRQIVTGLLEPTGLAVSPSGTFYVAELFGNDIVQVTHDRSGTSVSPVVTTPNPGDVEWTRWGLYFTSNVLSGTDPGSSPAGQLIRYGF